MLFTFYFALNSGIVYFAYFLRIESSPFLIVKTLIKLLNCFYVNKVNKCITNVAVIEKVYWQIEEIKLILKVSIKSIEHLFLCIFIGYVSYH